MSEVAYLKITDKTKGYQMKGGCTEKDNKDMIVVQKFEHAITIPTHRQSGAATGETLHGALKLTCPMDRSSPLLQLALTKHNEVEGEIHFYRTRDGKREHWYTIKFEDARLVEIFTYKELVLRGGDIPDMNEIHVRYKKIEWEHKIQNKQSEANWEDK